MLVRIVAMLTRQVGRFDTHRLSGNPKIFLNQPDLRSIICLKRSALVAAFFEILN